MKLRKSRKRPEASPKEEKPFFSKTGNEPGVQTKEEGFFQTKLAIGQPGDRFEQEADQMADAVVNRSRPGADEATAVRKKEKLQRQEEEEEAQPKLQRQEEEEAQPKLQRMEEEEAQPKLQRMEEEEAQPKLQRMEEEEEAVQAQAEEEEEPLQAKAAQNTQAGPSLQQRLAENKGKGRQLSPQVQDKMENAFDADFSGVRVHTDQEAVQMNQELGAQAFTHGQDVYFNEGKFNPENSSGEHLLAHELTHVVQQNKKKP